MAEKSSLKGSRSVLGLLGPNELTSPPGPGQQLPSAGVSAKDEPCCARETNAGGSEPAHRNDPDVWTVKMCSVPRVECYSAINRNEVLICCTKHRPTLQTLC